MSRRRACQKGEQLHHCHLPPAAAYQHVVVVVAVVVDDDDDGVVFSSVFFSSVWKVIHLTDSV